MIFPLAQWLQAPYMLGAAALVALALLLLYLWLRRPRGGAQPVSSQVGMSAHDPRDEITQPLPVTIRPRVNTLSSATVRAAARTDKGRSRPINEDDTLLAELADSEGRIRTGLYAVADGMGGHDQGEVASRTAIEATIDALQVHPFFAESVYLEDSFSDNEVLDVLRDAMASANKAVYGVRVEQGSNLGTTLVLALVLRSKAYIANVGDSRAYLIRHGEARQLTEDHSLVERMVATGQITRAEARLHPQRNLILRSLGSDPHIDVDLFVEHLQPGDRLLLCSDGLTGMLADDKLSHLASAEPDLDKACRMLVRAANEAGGTDNISVVLAKVLDTDGHE
ncbi:MAG: Stp1/IreP family PP2C-type Ser/Thr phosphatase [Chloroflexota bacterium]|nr:Stp1/IreP family PP2C-type Ser/Thr phosphatase [Chloroflexota bacterium]